MQRQVLFTVDDVGKSKAETAKTRLLKLNPHVKITVHNTAFTKDDALDIIKDYDVVADGTDNFPTRYLVNDACVLAGKVNVYASIFRFEGQATVFNYQEVPLILPLQHRKEPFLVVEVRGIDHDSLVHLDS